LINGRIQPVGRPLAASAAQCAEVLKLHKAGRSLRGIVEDTNLGLNTVRTIVGKAHGPTGSARNTVSASPLTASKRSAGNARSEPAMRCMAHPAGESEIPG
jgi:hypothetical protein